MSKCKELRSLFIDALCDRLSAQQAAQLEEHRKACDRCARRFAGISETLQIMARRERTDPGQEFWDGYWTRLADRMNFPSLDKEGSKGWWLRRSAPDEPPIPGWIVQIAAVLLLVGAGILIGKFYFGAPRETQIAREQTPPSVAVLSSEQRASHFLAKSETLLLALVNYDPESEALETLNFKRQKEVSQQLVREAGYLQKQLRQPDNRKLQKLISDLQVVLLQIANLEVSEDIPEIELVKSGVDRKGILLKINLEQMRIVSEEAEESRVNAKSEKSGI